MKREKAIRSRHTGHLELRGTKWMATWMENGKRHAASTGETDRAKAEKWLEDRLRPLRLVDQLNAHKTAVNPTIQRVKDATTAWDEWLASIPDNPVTAHRALKRKQQIKDDVTALDESCRVTLATLKQELANIEASAPGLKFSEAW